MRHALRLFLVALFVFGCGAAALRAQCDDWRAVATITTPSNCSPTHSVTVSIAGPDAGNLTKLKYGIPIGYNGYGVPLGSSPTFTGLQSGYYRFSAVGMCNGVYVGRNTSLYVDAGYVPAKLSNINENATLSCGAFGRLWVYGRNGAPPYQFTLISHPASYTGAKRVITRSNYTSFDSLPAGSYTVRMVDTCGSADTLTATVGVVNESTIPLLMWQPSAAGCDTLVIPCPGINASVPGWGGFSDDSGFTVTAQVSGGLSGVTQPLYLGNGLWRVRLAAGKTLKDCYGKQIIYTVYMPCGAPVTRSITINAPSFQSNVEQHCDKDFDLTAYPTGLFCYPLTLRLVNTATNLMYGPFIATGPGSMLKGTGMPLGQYLISVTTGDGHTMTSSRTVSPVGANPYSVSVIRGANGLNGWAAGFRFLTTGPAPLRTVELFSGPAGYVHRGQWYGTYPYTVTMNDVPTASTVLFPAGTYVWKITDDCGVYYVTATVSGADLYTYVIDSISTMETCDGLQIRPWIRSWRGGVPQADAAFAIMYQGYPYPTPTSSGGRLWQVYPSGTAVTVTDPGSYHILATTAGYQPATMGTYPPAYPGYPNIYNVSAPFSYNRYPLWVDTDLVQGFVCQGAPANSAQVHLRASGGFPFRTTGGSPFYRYSLAAQGAGHSGPYIATNTTGVFTGITGPPNAWYDVKISDSCGDSLIRRVQILDLNRVGLITSSDYVVCRADSFRLSALYLPNATYSWTGPFGFSANVQRPLIAPLLPVNSGIYRVTVNTSACSRPVSDSSILAVNNVPHKPTVSFTCDPRPPIITVTNPRPGHEYLWDFGQLNFSRGVPEYMFGYVFPGMTPYSTRPPGIGKIYAISRDSTTGCENRSDTLNFDSDPWRPMKVTITAARLNICVGDTTTLQATGITSQLPVIQWFRNGVALPGATGKLLITNQPGSYRVAVNGGVCDKDTSPAVQVQVVNPPFVQLSASDTIICQGDTALLHTPHTAGYTYSWMVDTSTVPGAFDSTLIATRTGRYAVIVSNGACIVTSPPLLITVNPAPVLQLKPEGEIHICPAEVYPLTVSSVPGVSFAWTKDGNPVSGGTGAVLPVSQPGAYRVTGSIPGCRSITSDPVTVKIVTAPVRLPPDTTICNDDPFSIPLQITDTGFSGISWSTGAAGPAITVSATGMYWARGIHRCGTYADTMYVRSYREYDPMWPEDTLVCNASGINTLRVPALLRNVRWSNGATGHSVVAREQGLWWVEGESPCGPVRDSIVIRFCPPRIRDLGINADTVCVGDCIRPVANVDNYPVYHYWSFPGGRPDTAWGSHPGVVCFPEPGVHRVSLRVTNPGGSDSAEVNVVVVAKPETRFRDTALTAPYRSKVYLPACADASHADWYCNDSLVCRDCPVLSLDANYYFNRYRCVVRNAGCPDSCSYALRVIDIPHEIWLPDAFTPNGDGRNDRFGIITDNPNVQLINFEVFNRWGQRVFSGNLNNNGGWDGTFGGRPAELATYNWQLHYRILDKPDVVHYLKGDVLLVR